MRKKYELTEEVLEWHGHKLHRIKALQDFGNVEAGDIGGWIEKEDNLSHVIFDNCWVFNDAKVYGNAKVTENAHVFGNAHVFDCAGIYGDAKIYEYARVSGNAQIHGNAKIHEHCWINGNAKIYDSVNVYENAEICGNACIYENAEICGNAAVYGNTNIRNDGYIENTNDYITIGPIGSRKAFTTFYKTKGGAFMATTGCFCGTLEHFINAVKNTHVDNTIILREYMEIIECVKKIKNIQTK